MPKADICQAEIFRRPKLAAQTTAGAMNLDKFKAIRIETNRGAVFIQTGGTGPTVLLLHGFPETSLMWRDVAPLLSSEFTIVAADLPGYGRSDPPAPSDDHTAMSKREMATTLVTAMQQLGHERFAIVGHDRGGRVAYRAALDHPGTVTRLAVLDVIPTYEVWAHADARLALAFWPFSLLAQPAPLGERLLSGAPDAVVDDALSQWGSPTSTFSSDVRQAYVEALQGLDRIHAICEEYRAAATIDRIHDRMDLEAGRCVECPVLALWSSTGALGSWYENAGGPLGIWRRWARSVSGQPVAGGHFFPEEVHTSPPRYSPASYGNRLDPKHFLNALAHAHTDRIAGMARGAPIDGRASAVGVLRDMRRDAQPTHFGDEVGSVVGLT
jgi:haloacetate dehalogenase